MELDPPSPLDDLPSPLNGITGDILDVAFRVHSAFGPGLYERVYRDCVASGLRRMGYRVDCEVPSPVTFEGERIEGAYRMDMRVQQKVVVEFKAIEQVLDVHLVQLWTYLRLSHSPVGLLLNFRTARVKDGIYRRVNSCALEGHKADD